jgi:hypothetical protein
MQTGGQEYQSGYCLKLCNEHTTTNCVTTIIGVAPIDEAQQ